MNNKPNAIIFDIDGTLCDTEHRSHLAREKNWKGFFELMTEDTPKHEIIEILRMYREKGYKILLVTGRSDDYKDQTIDWFIKNDLGKMFNELYMRKADDFRKDEIIKSELYKAIIEPQYSVRTVFEDRSRVVNMWRELGLVCLQVDHGNF